MSVFFYCDIHGRFSVFQLYPERAKKAAEGGDLSVEFSDLNEAPCPVKDCGKISKSCRCNNGR